MVTDDIERLLDGAIREIVAAVHAGDVAPRELAAAAVTRAEAAPAHALLVVDGDVAAAEAADLEERLADGERPPLAGAPVAHKDLFDTATMPTTYGNAALAAAITGTGDEVSGARPGRDAVAVDRARRAGMIQIGTANLHEVAFGVTGENPHTGSPENPTAPGRIPGGSSSGSAAAVAAGSVSASLGTDTGGSVRIPAACCGVVGLKTTRGAVPTTGVLPLSWLQDTVGPLARSTADAALLLAAVVGRDGGDPVSREPPEGWSLADLTDGSWPTIWRAAAGGWEGPVVEPEARRLTVLLPGELWATRVHPHVRAACESGVDALEAAGATVEEVRLEGHAEARRAQGVLLAAHALAVHREWFSTDPDRYGADIRARLERAASLGAVDVVHALDARRRWIVALDELLADGTLIACPTLAFPPPPVGTEHIGWDDGDEEVTPALTRLTSIWNLAATPAISVPVGPTADGLPVGLQLVGRWWSEPTLLRAAAVVEGTARE